MTVHSIDEIFRLAPDLCTPEDIEALVKDFRAKRHLFNTGAAQAGSTKKITASVKLSIKDIKL